MKETKTEKAVFYTEHKLSLMAHSLCNVSETYERIKNGYFTATPELKKAVQISIKEFCTAICIAIEKD